MNRFQKKVTRYAKKLSVEAGVSFRRARKVSRFSYRFIDKIKKLE